jgi:hypothetical protein
MPVLLLYVTDYAERAGSTRQPGQLSRHSPRRRARPQRGSRPPSAGHRTWNGMTALEAGLLTGGLTGLFTLAAVVVTYLLQGRQQRALAQDERMWSRRAETYVAMLQYQGSGMVEGYIETASEREWAVRDELTAKAAAFASDEVRDLWQQSALAKRALQEYADENWAELTVVGAGVLALEDAAEKDPELRRLDQASAWASRQLAVQIRAELDVARHGRRQQRRQGHSQDSLPASFTSNLAGKLPPSGPESMTKSLPETPPGQLR